MFFCFFFFFQAEDGIRDDLVTGVQTCSLPIADLEAKLIRAVSPNVFTDDPHRLLRAVRLEDELGLSLEPETERLVREQAGLVTEPARERTPAEPVRVSVD